MHARRIILLALTLATAAFVGMLCYLQAAETVTLRALPVSGMEPLDVSVLVTVEKDVANRSLCLVWQSEVGESGSSCQQLDAERAPHAFFYWVKHLPGGEYGMIAVVQRADGLTRRSLATRIHVISRTIDKGVPRDPETEPSRLLEARAGY